jgi:hypothetical protein
LDNTLSTKENILFFSSAETRVFSWDCNKELNLFEEFPLKTGVALIGVAMILIFKN